MKNLINESNRIKELMNLTSINESQKLDVFPVDGDFNIGYDTEMSFTNPKHNSDFSTQPTGDGRHKSHIGVDIFCKKGDKIVAPVAGTVKLSDNQTSGKVVTIQDENGYCHFMGHLNTQDVEDGKVVFAGEKVGTCGNTGNAKNTSPHVHFNVYKCDSGFNSGKDPFNDLMNSIDKKAKEPDETVLADILKLSSLTSLKNKLEDLFNDDEEDKDIKDLESEKDDENEDIISLLIKKGENFIKKVIDKI